MRVLWGESARRTMERIDLLVRSRYPLLYVVSSEERRVQRALQEMCAAHGKDLFVWTVSDGIVDADGRGVIRKDKPADAIEEIRRTEKRAVWLLKDFHPYLRDAVVVRLLRDMIQESRRVHRTVVILAPSLEVPVELEKEIAVVEFPLPTYEELESLLDALIARFAADPRVRVSLGPEAKHRIVRSSLGLTLAEAEGIYCQAVITGRSLDDSDVELVLEAKKQSVRRSGLLEYVDASETMHDVGGLYELKRWLRKRRNAFSEEARAFGLPYPKGVMMIGVQGCGKSLCAKAISSLWRLPLLRLDVSRIFGKYIGSSEQNIRRALQMAETMSPCVLWIDEVEKAFSGVKSSGMSDAGTTARVFGYFLTWLQEKTTAVFVVCTANDVSQLPPEFVRRGRLDEIFFVDLPSGRERREIFAIHLKRRNREPGDFDLDALVAASEAHTGAEIEQAIIAALFDAFDDDMRPLATDDVLRALRETVPLSVTMREQVEALRAWAETRARPATGDPRPGELG